MMIPMFASLLLPALLAQDPEPRKPAPLALETASLQPLRWRRDSDWAPPPVVSLLDRIGGAIDLVGDEALRPSLGGELAIEWLQLLHPKECAKESTSLRSFGDTLVMQAEAPLPAVLAHDLQALQQIVTMPIELEAALYDFAGGQTADPVLDAAALARLVGERKPLWTSTRRSRSGGQLEFGRARWTSYVHGVQAEVAQKISVTSPILAQYFSGIRLSVVPHLLAGADDIVLHCQFAIGQPREVRIQATGFQGQPTLDVPNLEINTGACSGRVTPGGALAITLGGSEAGGSRLLLTIAARLPATRPAARIGDAMLLPISALTSTALQQPGSPPRFDAEIDPVTHDRDPQPAYGCFDEDLLLDLLRSAGGPAFGEDTAYMSGVGNAWLMLHADDAAMARVLAALQALQERFLVNAGVRLEAQLRETATAGTFSALAERGAVTALHSVALPSLLGRQFLCCRGLETTAMRGISIEIAQEAEVQHPAMSSQTTGLWCSGAVAPTANGAHLQLQAALNLQDPTPQRQFESGGVMMLPRPETTRVAFGEQVPDGAEVGLGEGPRYSLDGRSYRSTLMVRVTTDH